MKIKTYLPFIIFILLVLLIPFIHDTSTVQDYNQTIPENGSFSLSNIPEYSGDPYIVINNNIPYIRDDELVTKPFEIYSELDNLGRCGVAYANICKDIMPTESREEIGSVKPSGWIQNKYDKEIVDGGYLYNRCHLIGFQLAGENANPKNLITGTRYLNIDGMLSFENLVADYVSNTNHHVLYRVTPIFEDNNLLASGVLMEARSVEEQDLQFCVYAYNVQPGIHIEYSNGDNWEEGTIQEVTDTTDFSNLFIINTNTNVFHKTTCSKIPKNKNHIKETDLSSDELINQGYKPCGICKP